MFIPTSPQNYSDGIVGDLPTVFSGQDAIDGATEPFVSQPAGTLYVRFDAGNVGLYQKEGTADVTADWNQVGGTKYIEATIAYTDFTDGGSTAGTYDLTETIPAGAIVQATSLSAITGFAGDTSAVITVGDGSDVDRYNTGTPDVFSTVAVLDAGAVSGTAFHATAATVTVTVTTAADFTSVSAGSVTVRIYYI